MGETNSTTIHTTSEMLDYAYGQLLDGDTSTLVRVMISLRVIA
jgi:hypothetical protein